MVNVKVADAEVNLDQVISILLVTVPVKKLRIQSAPVTKDAIATIAYCSTITELYMADSDLKDEDAKEIADAVAQSKSIEVLDISGNDFSDSGCLLFLAALNKNTRVNDIRLGGNGKISGDNRAKIELKLRERKGGVPQAA